MADTEYQIKVWYRFTSRRGTTLKGKTWITLKRLRELLEADAQDEQEEAKRIIEEKRRKIRDDLRTALNKVYAPR